MFAILIVDLQRAFPVPADLVRRIDARSRDFPLRIFTKYVNPPGSLMRRRLGRESCAPGTPETELILPPRPGDLVLEKPGYGLLNGQIEALQAAQVSKVLVCGVDTDACVLGVMFSLFDTGIECEIDPSLCWSSMGLHEVALKIIRAQFGTG